MVCGGIGNTLLYAVGFKVGVADFYSDASGELSFLSELGAELLGHRDERCFEQAGVDGILFKGVFGGDGFSFGVRNHWAEVDAICLFPDQLAIFPKGGF